MYIPSEAQHMETPMLLQTATTGMVLGVKKKTYTTVDTIFCNFKSFGGTEVVENGIIVIKDTAQITCWYRPDITASCCLVLCDGTEDTETPKRYEILGTPEDIEMKHQFMKFKIERIVGGA